jgi:hypothetical protein
MTSLIVLLLATFAADSRLTGLSVAPVADRTEVMILVDGSVTARHFMMEDGRLVLDLTGVPEPPRLDLRDFNRGGVRELRIAPFQPNVARVVIALDSPSDYDVARDGDRILVSFPNRGGQFEAWSRPFAGAAAALPAATERTAPPPQPAPARAAEPVAEPVRQPLTRQQQPITITFAAEPLNNVLGIFSDFAGRTIIPSADVQARPITAELRGVPWDLALEGILQANGMIMRTLPSNIILVEDASRQVERQASEPTVTQAFTIQYISADSIRQAVQGLLSPIGRVAVNSASNSLLITDAASVVERLRDVLPQLDTRRPQVDISTTIAFIDRTTLESFGIVYDLKDSRGSQINRLVTGAADLDGDGVIEPITETLVSLGGASVAALGNANYRVAAPSL